MNSYHGLTDPDPVLFVSDLQDINKKEFFFQIFLLITFDGTFTSFFIDKKSLRSHKTEEIKVYLTTLFDDGRIRNSGS